MLAQMVAVDSGEDFEVPLKIVSGGQTGIDRAGLDAAIELDISCGGWCPKGRLSEDGTIPSVYPLKEASSKDYRKRTEMNVVDSDATLIITEGKPSGGTALTIKLAQRHDKQILVVDLSSDPNVIHVVEWLITNQIHTLNVAGPRESKNPGIQQRGKDFLLSVIREFPYRRNSRSTIICQKWTPGSAYLF